MPIVATRAPASRTVVSGKAVERLIGQWSWAMMLRRCALSILGETYRWVRENCTCDAYLPGLVRDELLMLTALAP